MREYIPRTAVHAPAPDRRTDLPIQATITTRKVLWAGKPGITVAVTVEGNGRPDMDLLSRDLLALNGWESNIPALDECHVTADLCQAVYVPAPPDEDGYDMPAWRKRRDEVQRIIQDAADDGGLSVRAADPNPSVPVSRVISIQFSTDARQP